MISKELLSILACPACQGDVSEREGKIFCLNASCGNKYPIKDGIPVMLVDEAEK
jgi:uncharacterized protein YbaR (Trm112 family)